MSRLIRIAPPALALATACTVLVLLPGCKKDTPSTTVTTAQPAAASAQPAMPAPSATPKPTAPADPAAVVVLVNGAKITAGEVYSELSKAFERIAQRMPAERLAQMEPMFKQQITESLILKKLLTAAVDQEKVVLSPTELEEAITRFKSSLPPGSTLEELLKRNGATEAQFREEVTLDLRVNKLLEQKTKAVAAPTEAEIAEYYAQNKARFEAPESVTAKHILLATTPTDNAKTKVEKRAKATALREQLVKGADFAKLASENSDCPSKARGGSLGSFGRGQMVPAFEQAAFGQKIGEVGPVVETQFGYHVIVTEKHEPARTMPLAEIKDRLAQMLTQQKRQQAAQVYVEGLKSAAKITQANGQPFAFSPPPAMPGTAPAAAQPAKAKPVAAAPAPVAKPKPVAKPAPKTP